MKRAVEEGRGYSQALFVLLPPETSVLSETNICEELWFLSTA